MVWLVCAMPLVVLATAATVAAGTSRWPSGRRRHPTMAHGVNSVPGPASATPRDPQTEESPIAA